MKQHIAKLLVFLMLMTTMIVPADLSFAESGNENTTQTEESNAPQEKPDSTQETSAKSTNDEKIVEHESSPNSSVAKESIIAAENDQLEETVTERMEFLYIESKELVAPGTQNIVVSWTEAIDDIQNMVLEYENEQGKTLTLKESKRNDESIVFTKDFTASEAGTYKIKGVQYFVGNEEKYFAFDDVEIAASFKVVKGQDIEDDAIAKVEVDSNGTVNKKEVNSEIKDAVASTDAAPKTQTKARRAKSSNIVVVLDPGHGGSDSGATRGSVYEKNINFKVAQYCKAELEQYCGVTVYMTRTGDTNPSLQERAQIAANYGANILVSIHQNSGSSSAYGAEVYYPNRNYKPAIGDSGKAVADSIQKELVSLGLSNRGTKIRNTANGSTYADGSYSDYYGIIRNSKNLGIPAIIVEHAFLSNASDYNNFLSSDSKLQKLGIADATGIAKAFGLRKSGLFYDGTGWKFLNDDKTYFQDGWKTINGKKYYFKDEYALIGWQILDGNKYYFMPDGYAITGWFSFGSIRYYANDKGVVQKGMQQISGKYYYLGEDGVMQTGWKTLNGDRYFFMPDGYAITGWFSFGSIRYYANDKGIVQKGMQQISGKYYYLGEDGVMQTGWKTLNGDRYFFMPDGYAITGWFSFGSIRYYANDKGIVQTGNVVIDGKVYRFNSDGVLIEGVEIGGQTQTTVRQMIKYYNSKGKKYPSKTYASKGATDIEAFCEIYYEESQAEGIRAEVAFCQAMKETGWLQFGGDVKVSQCNFAGIGATGGGISGASFKDVRTGVRAQIQHLKAYANTLPLNNACVDPRFKYVKRGSAPYVEWLGKNANPNGVGWAPAADYGTSIVQMIDKLLSY